MTQFEWFTNAPVIRQYYAASHTGDTDHALHKQFMMEWYGLRPGGRSWDTWYYRATCECWLLTGRNCSIECQYRGRDLYGLIWDHPRAWRHIKTDERVLTLEPYGNPFDVYENYLKLEKDMRSKGIAISFEGRSPYGASYVLFLARDDTQIGRRMRNYQRYNQRHPEQSTEIE